MSFFNLPAEVRIGIYRQLFDSSQLSLEPTRPAIPHCRRSICTCAFPWQIVNTCQKLRDEALPYLLGATTLQVAGAAHKANLLPPLYLVSIPRAVILNVESYLKRPLELDKFLALRTLELRKIAVWCNYHDEESLLEEGGDEVMMNMAMHQLKRISVQLYRLCNQKDRSFNVLLFCRYIITSVSQETLDAVIDVDTQTVLHKQKGGRYCDRNAYAGFY